MRLYAKQWVSAAAVAAFPLLCGCGNALFFYETGKLSMTLEGRPDSSEPVQGSVGFKQRTVVVAPPVKDAQGKNSESSSMIAAFDVDKKPGFWEPLTLDTSLITGRAATCLSEQETQHAANIVAGTFNSDAAAMPLRNRITAWLDANDAVNRPRLKAYLAKANVLKGGDNEVNWLFTAPASQLQAAIDALGVP